MPTLVGLDRRRARLCFTSRFALGPYRSRIGRGRLHAPGPELAQPMYRTIPDLGKARRQFRTQKYAAERRFIGFELTFDEWCRIWDESGCYPVRGRRGYVMARSGDDGPYAVGNVSII